MEGIQMKISEKYWLFLSLILVLTGAVIWSCVRYVTTPSREAKVEERAMEVITTNRVAASTDGITVTGSVKPTFSDKIK